MAKAAHRGLVLREGVDILVLEQRTLRGWRPPARLAHWARVLAVAGMLWLFRAAHLVVSLIMGGVALVAIGGIYMFVFGLILPPATVQVVQHDGARDDARPPDARRRAGSGEETALPYRMIGGRHTRTSPAELQHERWYGAPDRCPPGCLADHDD